MKMLKKLMALALAGAMALMVLTGCGAGAALNKKEIINALNDFANLSGEELTIEQGSDALAKQVLSKTKTFVDNHLQAYTSAESLATEALYRARVGKEDPADIRSIVPKDTKDQYTLMFAPVAEYQSKDYKNYKEMIATMTSVDYYGELNEIEEDTLGKKATASIATQKIGDTTFLVIVLVQAAK